MKEQKTARDYIAEIIPNKANFEYCGQAGKINGSLLLDIEIAMQSYSDQQNAELRERVKELEGALTATLNVARACDRGRFVDILDKAEKALKK